MTSSIIQEAVSNQATMASNSITLGNYDKRYHTRGDIKPGNYGIWQYHTKGTYGKQCPFFLTNFLTVERENEC